MWHVCGTDVLACQASAGPARAGRLPCRSWSGRGRLHSFARRHRRCRSASHSCNLQRSRGAARRSARVGTGGSCDGNSSTRVRGRPAAFVSSLRHSTGCGGGTRRTDSLARRTSPRSRTRRPRTRLSRWLHGQQRSSLRMPGDLARERYAGARRTALRRTRRTSQGPGVSVRDGRGEGCLADGRCLCPHPTLVSEEGLEDATVVAPAARRGTSIVGVLRRDVGGLARHTARAAEVVPCRRVRREHSYIALLEREAAAADEYGAAS